MLCQSFFLKKIKKINKRHQGFKETWVHMFLSSLFLQIVPAKTCSNPPSAALLIKKEQENPQLLLSARQIYLCNWRPLSFLLRKDYSVCSIQVWLVTHTAVLKSPPLHMGLQYLSGIECISISAEISGTEGRP